MTVHFTIGYFPAKELTFSRKRAFLATESEKAADSLVNRMIETGSAKRVVTRNRNPLALLSKVCKMMSRKATTRKSNQKIASRESRLGWKRDGEALMNMASELRRRKQVIFSGYARDSR